MVPTKVYAALYGKSMRQPAEDVPLHPAPLSECTLWLIVSVHIPSTVFILCVSYTLHCRKENFSKQAC
jgi:hypothetical protein